MAPGRWATPTELSGLPGLHRALPALWLRREAVWMPHTQPRRLVRELLLRKDLDVSLSGWLFKTAELFSLQGNGVREALWLRALSSR